MHLTSGQSQQGSLVEILFFSDNLCMQNKQAFSFFTKRCKNVTQPIHISVVVSLPDIVGSASCSHMRATEYYIASVGQCSWQTRPCESYGDCTDGKIMGCPASGCPSMGFDADSAKHSGRFYLQTKSNAPFCCRLD